jgi:hypothetical protein
VATAHTVAREIRAEEAYRVDPERFRGSPLPCSSCWGRSPDWAHESTERIRAALPDARVSIPRGQGHAAIMTAPEPPRADHGGVVSHGHPQGPEARPDHQSDHDHDGHGHDHRGREPGELRDVPSTEP